MLPTLPAVLLLLSICTPQLLYVYMCNCKGLQWSRRQSQNLTRKRLQQRLGDAKGALAGWGNRFSPLMLRRYAC